MIHKFIKLPLAFALLVTLSACTGKDGKNSPSSPTQTAKNEQPSSLMGADREPVAPLGEEPKEEVIDLSWVPNESVSCREKSCIPSVPIVFARPTADAKAGSLALCMGVLVDQNTVVASGNCLPADVAEGKVSCKGRIFVKFPSLDSILPERGVGCDSLEKFSLNERNRYPYFGSTPSEDEAKTNQHKAGKQQAFKPNFMVIKLSGPVERINYPLNNQNAFRSAGQYVVAKLEVDPSNHGNAKAVYRLTSQLCPTLENRATDEGKAKNLVALDCDLSLSAGAPIFERSPGGGLSLTGIVHSQVVTVSSLLDQIVQIGATYRSKVYLGFSHKCINEIDCIGLDVDSVLYADPVEDLSKTEANAIKEMEEWMEKSPLSQVIQWQVVRDLAKYAANNFYLYIYPTLKDGAYVNVFGRRESVKCKDYKMATLIPKCAKTVEPKRWIEAYLALDTLTDLQRSMLKSNYSGVYGALMPTDDFEFNMPTWVRKEYETIGASNFIGERKFRIEIRNYGERDRKAYQVNISSYAISSDDHVAYDLMLPPCELNNTDLPVL